MGIQYGKVHVHVRGAAWMCRKGHLHGALVCTLRGVGIEECMHAYGSEGCGSEGRGVGVWEGAPARGALH